MKCLTKHIVAFIVLSFTSLSLVAQDIEEVFDDFENRHNVAKSKANAGDYISAYDTLMNIRKDMEYFIYNNAVSLKTMNFCCYEIYIKIQESYAQVSYALGLKDEMSEIIGNLKDLLQRCDTLSNEREVFYGIEMLAQYSKICGDYEMLYQRYQKAAPHFMEALSMAYKNPHGLREFIWKTHVDLASASYNMKMYDKCLLRLDSALCILQKDLDGRITTAKDDDLRMVKTQRAVCLARLGRYTDALNEINKLLKQLNILHQTHNKGFAECLRVKAKILMLDYDATGKYNDEARKCYEKYFSLSKKYAAEHFTKMSESKREQYWMAEKPFVTDCFRLTSHAPSLLYNVALYSKAILLQLGRLYENNMTPAQKKAAMAPLSVTWQDVQKKLTQKDCAIEFLQYEKSGEEYLGAVVITKMMTQPRFLEICSVKSLNEMKFKDGLTFSQAFVSAEGSDKDALYTDSLLMDKIWTTSLVSAIGKCNNIYFSPDGIFHQLSIESLLPQTLRGKKFYRLTSTRSLTYASKKLSFADKALLCGGVEYTTADGKGLNLGNDAVAYRIISSEINSLAYLSGTKREVDSIAVIRDHNNDIILYGSSVTEDTLKALMPKCSVIHIATHGYFAEQNKRSTDIEPSNTDIQLSKSCVFLAGSVQNMQNKNFNPTVQSDGILSAREIAKLDLSNVNLVILSACLSGVGSLTPDGVYGLQRGLKAAGADAMIVSLWQVDDAATVTFMSYLYKNLHNGMTLHEAFYEAQECLRTKVIKTVYGNRGKGRKILVDKSFNNPRYYNAFVLIDAK